MVVVEVVVRGGGKHSQTLAGLLKVGWYRVNSEDKMQRKMKEKRRKSGKKERKKERKKDGKMEESQKVREKKKKRLSRLKGQMREYGRWDGPLLRYPNTRGLPVNYALCRGGFNYLQQQ